MRVIGYFEEGQIGRAHHPAIGVLEEAERAKPGEIVAERAGIGLHIEPPGDVLTEERIRIRAVPGV
jgi:hypothetical protein